MTSFRFSRRALLGAPLLGVRRPPPAAARLGDDRPATTGTGAVAMYRGNAARTGELPGPGPSDRPTTRWEIRLGDHVVSSPAVVAGVVYVGSLTPSTAAGGALHAVDAATGEELWRAVTDHGDGFFAGPAVVDGTVYVGGYDGIVLAVAASTGEERWRFAAVNPVLYSSPAVLDGVVYLGDIGGRLYAIDATTGEERWPFTSGDGFDRSIGSPAVAAGTVYAVSTALRVGETAVLHALDVATGEERWRFAPDGDDQVRGIPAVADGRVHVATTTGLLYALDAEDGEERWRFDGGSGARATSPAVVDGDVLVGTDDGKLHTVDAATGDRSRPDPSTVTTGSAFTTAPTVVAGTVYVGDDRGRLHAVDPTTGDVRWRIDTGSGAPFPAIVDGTIYVGGNDGVLRAFADGKPDEPLR